MVGGRRDFPGIADLETDRILRQPGALGVVAGELDRLRVQVVADERRVQLGQDTRAGVVLQVAPAIGVVAAQALEAEGARDARGHAQGDPGALDEDGARAAEWVQQRGRRVPARQRQHAGGQVLAQRRLALVQAPAALEQGFTRGVQVQRGGVPGQEQVHAGVRPHRVDAGAFAFQIAQAVADAVLGAQIAVLQALHRALDGRGVHAQGLLGAEPAFPGGVTGQVQDVVFVRDLGVRDLHQDAGRQARIQVGALHARPIGGEGAAGAAGLRVVEAQRLHFRRQRLFQPLGAGGENGEHFGLARFTRAAAAGFHDGRAFGRFSEFRRARGLGFRQVFRRGAVVFEGVVEAPGRGGGRNVLVVQARRALRGAAGARAGRGVAARAVAAACGAPGILPPAARRCGLARATRGFLLAPLIAFRVFLALEVVFGALLLGDQAGAGSGAHALGRGFGVRVARGFLDRQRLARAVLVI
ncbi:hypothetical protein D9M68_519090 [compost metagenome]